MPLFAIALLIFAWLAVAANLSAKRQNDLAAEVRQNRNLAKSLEEQVVRVMETTDQALLRLSAASAEQTVSGDDLVRFANETGLSPHILVQLSLLDGKGRFIGSNLDPRAEKSGHVDLSEREHVKVHLVAQAPSRGAQPPLKSHLFVGKPVLGKVSGQWTIQLSRRVARSDGTTAGIVVASLDPMYFEEVFRRVDLGGAGGVALIGSDLNIRARVVGGRSEGMGTTLPGTSQFAAQLIRHDGDFVAPSQIDGVERLVVFRKVANFPLFVIVASGKQDALAGWRDARRVTLALLALLSVAVILAIVGFVAGLRKLEATNAALIQSEAAAQAANQAKSEFLVAISHEFRTPLTSIRGFAELMEQRLDQPRMREQAGLIRKSADYLNVLFSNILDLVSLESGSIVSSPTQFDVRMLAQQIHEFFQLSAQAKQLAFHLEISRNVPAQFFGDELRIKQALSYLLSNAFKFTTDGEVTLAVEYSAPWLKFTVTDTGPGIEEGMHEAIFESFRQGSDRTSYQHGGAGLGLALVRRLAQVLNGRIFARTDTALGASFVLELPEKGPEQSTAAESTPLVSAR